MAAVAGSTDSISHFAALRMLVTGTGKLAMSIHSLYDIRSKVLVPFNLTNVIRVIPTRLVNFSEQRVTFEFKTTNMDDRFRIMRIIIFAKETDKSHPGN